MSSGGEGNRVHVYCAHNYYYVNPPIFPGASHRSEKSGFWKRGRPLLVSVKLHALNYFSSPSLSLRPLVSRYLTPSVPYPYYCCVGRAKDTDRTPISARSHPRWCPYPPLPEIVPGRGTPAPCLHPVAPVAPAPCLHPMAQTNVPRRMVRPTGDGGRRCCCRVVLVRGLLRRRRDAAGWSLCPGLLCCPGPVTLPRSGSS